MTQLRSELAKQKEEEKKQLEVILSREVSEADVKVVAEALDVEEAAAKRLLQEHKGDVTAVLREAVHLPQKKG
ncbi:hypothetical protein AGDE_16508 [Angomonas deanei]|uniref:Nascent polypeptide-associated complex subunit alpha-like UBA domain-containing protein n=1 Tax=Angomonas deanei TaxID=59799 RepID=A0A7G2CK62_9TRYP|nr:hypothetical protein AGDE_16508 [Angomonas deanei]CAD2219284.1 hypothetical protein, conserved [Angomonas deanei]|eukprot:EPY16982.1 hypothetical protein AGDE_16508 [Angomonas deanei]